MRRLVIITTLAWLAMPVVRAQPQDSSAQIVARLRIDDEAITPVTVRYLERAFGEAAALDAKAILIQLDTPGGLVQSTRTIVKQILSSPIPVIVYVAPSGSRAASAGVFITLAAHVAAMSPGTHIGAAHPVQIGGEGVQEDSAGTGVMDDKVLNDARAWARSLAELRGRNADWAEAAVAESQSITSDKAVEMNVIDLLAADIDELLQIIDGREVFMERDSIVLRVASARVVALDPWWGERLLGFLSNPNVAFLLLMLGFYGVLFEFYTPGWGVAGTVGALCLLLGFSGLAVLPINFVGLLLILIALALFVAEAFIPSFGALTVGGVICLVLGGLMLVDSPEGVLEVSKSVLIPVAIATALITVFLMSQIVKTHREPIRTGSEVIVGATAVVVNDFETEESGYSGHVRMHGELWSGISRGPLKEGDHVRVASREGLRLYVEEVGREK